MGMGGLSAVSRGSDRDCQLVIMEYKTKKKNAQTLAFVGKGITFAFLRGNVDQDRLVGIFCDFQG